MRAFYTVTLTTVRIWFREPLTVFLSLGLLALMMILFSTMGNDVSQYKLHVGVVGPQDVTAQIVRRLAEEDVWRVTPMANASDLQTAISRGRVAAGIVAPSVTTETRSEDVQYQVFIPQGSGKGWNRIGTEHLLSVLGPAQTPVARNVSLHTAHGPQISTRMIEFLYPGILALAILQTCLSSAVVFLDARRLGVLRRFKITPAHSASWSGGFLAGRCVIVLIHLVVLGGIARLLFHVHTRGTAADACLVAVLGTGCFLAMSGVIALLAPTVEAGALLVQLLNFPMSFLCGVFFRSDALPAWLNHIVDLLPLTYLVNLMRDVLQLGLPLSLLHHDLGGLLIWTAAAVIALMFASRLQPRFTM